MPKIKIERLLLIIFILIFGVTLLPPLVKRILPAPKVVEAVPQTSAINVPIDTQYIQFVFSQPMKQEKNMVYQGMRMKGEPKWIDERRTTLRFTLKEPLKPGAFYRIVLNKNLNGTTGNDKMMIGRWGKPLNEYIFTFMTLPSDTTQSYIAKFENETLRDTDKDGLNDSLETKLGTMLTTPDTDGDGLTDYEEYCKYRTNPILADSDADGTSDAEWNERREYTYSIRVVLELKPPWNLEAMNDLFQDARLMKNDDPNYQKIEIVIYPYASPVLLPTPYPYRFTLNPSGHILSPLLI